MDMLHLPFCPILVGVREPPGVASICAASRKLPCLDSPVQEGSGERVQRENGACTLALSGRQIQSQAIWFV